MTPRQARRLAAVAGLLATLPADPRRRAELLSHARYLSQALPVRFRPEIPAT